MTCLLWESEDGSLHLSGVGTCYEEFEWSKRGEATMGQVNEDQYFACTPVFMNEIIYDNPGQDHTELVEVAGKKLVKMTMANGF